MSITLRPYQEKLIQETFDAWGSGKRRVFMQSPTASGKTTTFSEIARTLVTQGKRGLLLSHRTELVDQGAARLQLMAEQPVGIIQGTRPQNKDALLHSASVATLMNRLDRLPDYDFVITDEAHRATASSYLKIYERFDKALQLLVSATPIRSDGSGFRDVADFMVLGPSVRSLIDGEYAGSLAKYKLLADPTVMKTQGVGKSCGDYKTKELAEANDAVELSGNIVESYLEHAAGRQCLVFAINVLHAQAIAEAYRKAGISAVALDGTTPTTERNLKVKQFAAGLIRVVVNVGLFTEGTDIPGIEVVQIARPTQSLSLWLQMVGRGLRPLGNMVKLIIDHTDNWHRLGLPCRPRAWSLDGVEDVGAEPCVVMDKNTRQVVELPSPSSRIVEDEQFDVIELGTELTEISQDPLTQWQGTLNDLCETCEERGYNPQWVKYRLRELKPPVEIWQKAAEWFGYGVNWADDEFMRQNQPNKLAFAPKPAPVRKPTPIPTKAPEYLQPNILELLDSF